MSSDLIQRKMEMARRLRERREQIEKASSEVSKAPRLSVPERRTSLLDSKLRLAEKAAKLGTPLGLSDVQRIVALPIEHPLESKCPAFLQAGGDICPEHGVEHCCPGTEHDEICRSVQLASSYTTGFRLHEIQARAYVRWMSGGRGLLGPIGVGHGKTLVNYLIANLEYLNGRYRALLLVPAPVIQQTAFIDADWARARIPFPAPVVCLGGLPAKRRIALAGSGKRGIYVMPYSQLSRPDGLKMVQLINPDVILCDEVHKLANFTSARTRRLDSYIKERQDQDSPPDFGGWSGTITRKGLRDYAHLARWALGDRSFLPLVSTILDDWAAVVDSDAAAGNTRPGELEPLVRWAGTNFPREQITSDRAGFRRAFRLRMESCPGVAATGDHEIGTTLYLQPEKITPPDGYEGWDKLQELIRQVDEVWLTPNGDEIDHAIHKFKWLTELTCGGYYELTWPEAEKVAERRRIAAYEAQVLLDLAREHHEIQQQYARELRDCLLGKHVEGLDTPFLVGSHFHQHALDPDKHPLRLPKDLFTTWSVMKIAEEEAGGKERIERDARFVRVCDYRIQDAARRAKAMLVQAKKERIPYQGNISWFYHRAYMQWAVEVWREHGLDPCYCPAGAEYNERILNKENWNSPIIASMSAHGTGKNLQGMRYSQVVQWPRQATLAEQMLGRLHRVGQEADEIYVPVPFMTFFDWLNFAACLVDALYVQQTTKQRQKIVSCSYTELPKVVPPEVLRERGFHDVRDLDEEGKALLERFLS